MLGCNFKHSILYSLENDADYLKTYFVQLFASGWS